jgi:hypothetical protein
MEIILVLFLLFLIVSFYAFTISLFFLILGIGSMVGLPVGIFYGIKNYMSSILDNITNKKFKIIMMVITSLSIILLLLYMFGIIGR